MYHDEGPTHLPGIATAFFLLLILSMPLIAVCSDTDGKVQAGDIVFQVSQSPQSQAIQLATHSQYTHCGIVLPDSGGRLMVLEAIRPVVMTSFDVWTSRGVGHHFVVKRLRNSGRYINDSTIALMDSIGSGWLNRDYDYLFDWSDQSLYCSELVWKIYDRALGLELSPLRKLRDFDLTNPIVQAKLRSRYGDSVPLDEPVIAPSDLFDSDSLSEITRGGISPR